MKEALKPNQERAEQVLQAASAVARAKEQAARDQAAKENAITARAAAEEALAHLGFFELSVALGIDTPALSLVEGLSWCTFHGVESQSDFKYLTQLEVEEFVQKIAPAISTVKRRKLAGAILATANKDEL